MRDPLWSRAPQGSLRTRLLGLATDAMGRAAGATQRSLVAQRDGDTHAEVGYTAQAGIHRAYASQFRLLAEEAERGAYQ